MTRYRFDDPNKTCCGCRKAFPRTIEFFRTKGAKGWGSRCRQCENRHRKTLRKKAQTLLEKRAEVLHRNAAVRSRLRKQVMGVTYVWVREKLRCGVCEVTGLPFDFSTPCGPFAASIDRKDSSKSYTEENTQVVVWIHNAARNNWGDAPLHRYMKAYIKNKLKDG